MKLMVPRILVYTEIIGHKDKHFHSVYTVKKFKYLLYNQKFKRFSDM